MKRLNNDEVKVRIDDIEPFKNDRFRGFKILWSGNIGFGEYTIYRAEEDEQWRAESECMDTTDNKEFLALLLKDLMNQIEVEE